MKRMHFAPPEVRARICQLLEKEGKELIHLSYGLENELDTSCFIGVTCKCNAEMSSCYSLYTYDREEDNLHLYDDCLTYGDALTRMGKYIAL